MCEKKFLKANGLPSNGDYWTKGYDGLDDIVLCFNALLATKDITGFTTAH